MLLRERCELKERRADLMLVLDASSSMREVTTAGRTKLDAAVDAARGLIGGLDFAAGDRVGLVVFNEAVTVDLPPTRDTATLQSALITIEASPGTCIPCGVEVGLLRLVEVGAQDPEGLRSRALLLLTDGQSNVRPIEEAVTMANAAKSDRLQIFAVGLGRDVPADELRQIVSRPTFYFETLDAEALAEIFEVVATKIPCPSSFFWAGR
jgi:Mg-chelatase subunit ChlD